MSGSSDHRDASGRWIPPEQRVKPAMSQPVPTPREQTPTPLPPPPSQHRDDQLARIEQWLAAIEDRQERHRRWQMSHVTAAWRCLVWGLLVALAFGVIGFVIGSIAGSSAFGGIVGAVVGFICTSILTSIDVNRSSNRT